MCLFIHKCLTDNLSVSVMESLPMYLAEFVGTLIVTCTFAMVTQPNITYYTSSNINDKTQETQESFIAPVAVGFVMIALIYAFGHISGAHFNPSITIAVYIRGFITISDAFIFILVQLIGGFIGALCAWLITGIQPYIEPGNKYKDRYGSVFVIEFIYAFAIAIVVINVATTEAQRGNFFYGVSIGMCICAAVASAQKISGGAFNPAVGTALSITNVMRDHGTFKYIWIYWIGPIGGGVFGGLSYYVLNAKEIELMQQYLQQQQQQQLM